MPRFKNPQYSKITNPNTGIIQPCYTFEIELDKSEEQLSFIAENPSDISLTSLTCALMDNNKWWNGVIALFLTNFSKLFSKSYTVEQVSKIIEHTLKGNYKNEFPFYVLLKPVSIQIYNGKFVVNWVYNDKEILIDIPVPNESGDILNDIPDKNNEKGVEELDISSLPLDKSSTDDHLELDNNPTKVFDKQRVKEAKLKAKLAIYKAQYEMKKYYERYGDEITDSDSEDDNESSDGDEDEIQL
jgi:hypothetical protein